MSKSHAILFAYVVLQIPVPPFATLTSPENGR